MSGHAQAPTTRLTASLAIEIVESHPQPLVVVSSDLKVKFANRSFFETFALSESQVENAFLYNLEDGAWDKPQLQQLINDVLRHNRYDTIHLDFELSHHARHTFALTGRSLITSDGLSPCILLTLEDVTDRRKTDADRDVHTADLERSNTDLEQFAYVASHDLQEPLRMVASFTQLLAVRYQGKLDADADEYIAFAVDGAQRMRVLINDLLTYSRVGRREISRRTVDCGEILRVVQEDLNSAIAESGAVISYDALPTVEADPLQLGQLFQNLLGNAIKFRGTDSPTIRVSASSNGAEWTFSVQDNGIGIPLGQRHRIFDIFQRLHSRSEYPGTGIGLAICKKIVERHGGKIWVETGADRGTTFLFTLPVGQRTTP